MRLTNYQRDAFIRAVMDDVPKKDFDERIRKAAVEAQLKTMPKEAVKLWNDPETRGWLEQTSVVVGGISVYVPCRSGSSYSALRDRLYTELKPLADEALEHSNMLARLRERLRQVAYSVTTRKALAAALPEFEKYLPADDVAAVKTLPVVANVVADFVKAGWPKDK